MENRKRYRFTIPPENRGGGLIPLKDILATMMIEEKRITKSESITSLRGDEMNKEADREARIRAALTRYEASKTKQRKRKSFKLFSLDDGERKSREKVNSPVTRLIHGGARNEKNR